MLTDLFPSIAYLLAYALPLLFISIPLTFAGAFLTLDRTRVFTPRKDAGYEADTTLTNGGFKKSRNMLLLLEGGLGGLAGGYVCGRAYPFTRDNEIAVKYFHSPCLYIPCAGDTC
jgi:hypothetical protein